ncbi:MAG: alpha/beta fold hydrolase [Vicinamibacterales bacterium]
MAATSPALHAVGIPSSEPRNGPAALVLHGIYGRGRNWASVAKAVSRLRPDWTLWLVDLRGHGESPDLEPPHTVDASAADVARFTETHAVTARVVIGHSFGGKVALASVRRLLPALEQVWLIDSTPASRLPGGSAWTMLEALGEHPGPFDSRAQAAAALESAGVDSHVAAWMSGNLLRRDGRLAWRIDREQMRSLLVDFFGHDYWNLVETPPAGLEIHVIKASRSSVLDRVATQRVVAASRSTGRVVLHEIEGGHWLNADNPGALVKLFARHFPHSVQP